MENTDYGQTGDIALDNLLQETQQQIQETYDFILPDTMVHDAIEHACTFFNLPEVPVVDSTGVCVWPNTPGTPFDDVFGFVTIKDGIKIHRMSCANAARLMSQYPYRIQKVRWSESPSTSSFQVALKIIAAHEESVINDIFDTVNSFKASIRNFNVSDNDRNGTYVIQIKLSVPNNLELDKVISQIRVKKNIIKVNRL